jgi:hypothetical protein
MDVQQAGRPVGVGGGAGLVGTPPPLSPLTS